MPIAYKKTVSLILAVSVPRTRKKTLMTNDSGTSRRARSRERILKTVGVLPSLATLGNLTCGLGAIYLCMLSAQAAASTPVVDSDGHPTKVIALFSTYLSAAASILVLGMFFDAIDGRLARLARKTSEFGAQLDSLADIVSFGVAPACLVLMIAQPAIFSEMTGLGRWERAYWRAEWVMAAIYVCCTAMRLARFNVENEEDESAHMDFRGLPSPGAAGAIIAAVLLHEGLLPELMHQRWIDIIERLMPPFALMLGLLMVSPFRYPHMVNAILRGRRPFWQVVSIVIIVLIALVVDPEVTLAVGTAAYALYGPVRAGIAKMLGRTIQPEPAVPDDVDLIDIGETFEDVDVDLVPQDDDDATDADRVRFTG